VDLVYAKVAIKVVTLLKIVQILSMDAQNADQEVQDADQGVRDADQEVRDASGLEVLLDIEA